MKSEGDLIGIFSSPLMEEGKFVNNNIQLVRIRFSDLFFHLIKKGCMTLATAKIRKKRK